MIYPQGVVFYIDPFLVTWCYVTQTRQLLHFYLGCLDLLCMLGFLLQTVTGSLTKWDVLLYILFCLLCYHGHKVGEGLTFPFSCEPAAYPPAAAVTPVSLLCPPMSTWTSKSHTMHHEFGHWSTLWDSYFMESRTSPWFFLIIQGCWNGLNGVFPPSVHLQCRIS